MNAIREDDAVPVGGCDRARCLVHFFDGKQLDGVARADRVNLVRSGFVEARTDTC